MIKKIEPVNKFVYLTLAAYPFLMLLTRFNYLPRKYVEALFILLVPIVFLASNLRKFSILLFFIMFYLFYKTFYLESLSKAAYDLAALGILIYYLNNDLKINIEPLVKYFIFIEFLFGVIFYYLGFFVDYFRISSVFPSSMHYGFATAGLAFSLVYLNFSNRWIFFLLLLISALLSGSRAAGVVVILTFSYSLLRTLSLVNLVMITVISSALILFTLFFINDLSFTNVRFLSFVPASDSQRLAGYIDWIQRIDMSTALFGEGRYLLGSVGAYSEQTTIITESSILTFIEAYGFLFGFIVLAAPSYFFIKNLEGTYLAFTFLLFYFIAFIGPFFETPSLLTVNTIIIVAAIRQHKHINKKGGLYVYQ